MKIAVTGSLGHISKPLTQALIQQHHSVTVISSNPGRQKEISALGATAAIGTMEDAGFLTGIFSGADVAYVMEPPVNFFDADTDIMEFYSNIARNYATAIRQSGIKRIVHLSSIGGHTDQGNGLLAFHYKVEQILQALPADVAITTLRPVGFYYNLLSFIPIIKAKGIIATNYNAGYKEPWVSPLDIAATAAEEIVKPFEGRKIRYVASDELSSNEIAAILGEAIQRPELKWIATNDEEQFNNMTAAGMSPQAARGLVEMNAARQDGRLFEDYHLNRPVLGNVKIKDFAKEFAAAYNQN